MLLPLNHCLWCERPLRATRIPSVYCSRKCRQFSWRLRERMPEVAPATTAGRFGYADPPYPGLSKKYYQHEPSYGGEVDHRALVDALEAADYLGWALSTSERGLRDVLPLCPPGARVCVWTKPHQVPPATRGIHNVCEFLIVVRGRQRPPGRPNHLSALPARSGGTLPGRKPIAFCAWLFTMLGAIPGLDALDDLYPGSGIVGRSSPQLGLFCPS